MSRHDDVGRHQARAGSDQSADERHRRPKRWIGDDAERAAGQAKVRHVGHHDAHITAGEAAAEHPRPLGVQLERDHTDADAHERIAEHAVTGADVEHEVARGDGGLGDDARGPTSIEPVPPPAPRDGGAAHGT
jgi:hypothetical protein